MRLVLPRLYVILDAALIPTSEKELARELAGAGVRLLQYRNKKASARELLQRSREIAEEMIPRGVCFFVNDRADVAALAGASGVHVGQEDLDAGQAKALVGAQRYVGVSTHNLEQFHQAVKSPADYIAVGPIFATSSKDNPDPIVGTEFLRQVRPLTDKPIVAIGGITLERAKEVTDAGADSVAVISDILGAENPAERAHQYIERLGTAKNAAGA